MGRKLTSQERETLRLINREDTTHINCLRTNSTNSFTHELAKFLQFYIFRHNGIDVITEAKHNKGRMDLLNIQTGDCYEVISAEKPESIARKVKEYPFKIWVIDINHPDSKLESEGDNLGFKLVVEKAEDWLKRKQ